jgi:lambda family phage portal protein
MVDRKGRNGMIKEFFQQFLNRNLKGNPQNTFRVTTPSDSPEDDYSTADRKTAVATARRMVEESPLVSTIVRVRSDYVVGPEFKLVMNTGNKVFDREVEALWAREKDTLDVRNVRSWGQLLRCWHDRCMIDGDVGVWMIDGGVHEGVQVCYVQTIEGDRIRRNPNDANDTGITLDRFGRATKYYVGKRSSKIGKTESSSQPPKSTPVPANRFIHHANFPQNRAERVRGVSELMSIFTMIGQIDQMITAMMDKVKNEAFIGLKFKFLPNPGKSVFGASDTTRTSVDGKKRRHVKMVRGMNLNLTPGEDAEALESKSPPGQWNEFLRSMIRQVGIRVGLPLELLTLDFSNTNYTGGRTIIELSRKRFQVVQNDLGRVGSRVFQWWLSKKVKSNEISVPEDLLTTFWKHSWVMQRWPFMDPQKEANALAKLIDYQLITRTDVLAERAGVDLQEHLAKLKDEREAFEEAGVPLTMGQAGYVMDGVDAEPVTPSNPPGEEDEEDDDEEDDGDGGD